MCHSFQYMLSHFQPIKLSYKWLLGQYTVWINKHGSILSSVAQTGHKLMITNPRAHCQPRGLIITQTDVRTLIKWTLVAQRLRQWAADWKTVSKPCTIKLPWTQLVLKWREWRGYGPSWSLGQSRLARWGKGASDGLGIEVSRCWVLEEGGTE